MAHNIEEEHDVSTVAFNYTPPLTPDEAKVMAEALAKHRQAEEKRRQAEIARQQREADRHACAAADEALRVAVLEMKRTYWRKVRGANHSDKVGANANLALFAHANLRLAKLGN